MNLITKISFVFLAFVATPFQAQVEPSYYETLQEDYTLKTQIYGELNVAELTEKISIDQLTQSVFVDELQRHELDHFFDKMLPGMNVNIKRLKELGISTSDDLSFSFQLFDIGSIRMSFQLTIENKDLLQDKIEAMIASKEEYKVYYKSPDKQSHTFVISDYYSSITVTNLTINQDKVLFSVAAIEKPYVEEATVEIAAPYDYAEPEEGAEGVYEEADEAYEETDEESIEEIEEEPENYDEVIEALAPLFSELLALDNGKKSLPEHVKSELNGKKQDDLNFWIDYAILQEVYYSEAYRDLRSLPREFRHFLMQSMAINSEGSSYLMGVSFDEGEIVASLKGYFNERWKKTIKKYMKSSYEKPMLKYLTKNYLFCVGYSVSPQPFAEQIKQQYYPLLDSLLPSYAPTVKGIVEIVDLIVDEKALYKFIEGDVIMSFNGIHEVEVEVQQRVYDENYEYKYETVIQKREVPDITFMLSTKDEERWEKIIRMGLTAKGVFKEMDGYYALTLGREGNFYFAVTNGVVIVTTNKELVTQYLNKGLPKAMALTKEDKKVFNKNNILFLSRPMTVTPNEREFREFKKFTDEVKFQRMDVKGGKVKGNTILFSSSLTFDTEENSFDHLIKMLDRFMK